MVEHLYIHIPFCVRKCIYCDFLSIAYDKDLAHRYVTALIREFELRKEIIGGLKSVYIGGGTPSILPAGELARLLIGLKEVFALCNDAEFSMEFNPCSADEEKIKTLLKLGVNRFSLGIQSFNDRELQFLGRLHDRDRGLKAIETMRGCGVYNLSIDLIYGTPGQTLEDWESTLLKAIEVSPEHISIYELTYEEGTPLYRLFNTGAIHSLTEETILDMYDSGIDMLRDAGFKHYEVSNLARPGFECRHNLNCWERGEYLGVGAGAHSFFEGKRTKNTEDVSGYIKTILSGRVAVEEVSVISYEEGVKEAIMLGLRKMEGIDMTRFKDTYSIDLKEVSKGLIEDGFMIREGKRIKLTKKGLSVSNSIISCLFEAVEGLTPLTA